MNYPSQEAERWSGGERANFRAEAVIKCKPLERCRVEIVMDILRQVDADAFDADAETRRPLLRDGFEVFWRYALIAGLFECLCDRRFGPAFEGLRANGPEGEDERFSRARHPLFRQIKREVLRTI